MIVRYAHENRCEYWKFCQQQTSIAKKQLLCHMPASDLAVYDLQGQVYSYVEVSILIGLLLGSCTVDSIVTGCSCGQEMMLACNSVPGVRCGMIKDQKDAELFVSINR